MLSVHDIASKYGRSMFMSWFWCNEKVKICTLVYEVLAAITKGLTNVNLAITYASLPLIFSVDAF